RSSRFTCRADNPNSCAACDCLICFFKAFLSTTSRSRSRWVMVRTPSSFTFPAWPCQGDISTWHKGDILIWRRHHSDCVLTRFIVSRYSDRDTSRCMRLFPSITLLALLLPANTLAATCGSHGTRESLFVSTQWLADHLKDKNLVVLAIGDEKEYKQAHIP